MGKGRSPCCDKSKVKRGPWSTEEDYKLENFIKTHGHTNWRSLPKQADLLRCGKSCRLRWLNYLRPDIKRGNFTKEDEESIIKLHHTLGNKWSKIASHFPGRTDNEIKNVWNTYLKKRSANEEDQVFCHNEETKEISESSHSSSSSCTSTISPDGKQETECGIEGEKQELHEAKENLSSSDSSRVVDYFLNSELTMIDFDNMQTEDTDFLINDAYQENYGMFCHPNQNFEALPLEIDLEYLDMLGKDDPTNLYQSRANDFTICQTNTEEQNEKENECMKWLKNLENELLLETSNEGGQIL